MTALVTKHIPDNQQLAQLATAATLLATIDMAIPTPIPGIKPGFANIIILLTARQFGWHAALQVALLRCLTVSLFFGTFMTPSFFLSLSGSLCSLVALACCLTLLPNKTLGCVGLSIIAAFAHFAGQLLLVYVWLIRSTAILNWTPLFAFAACITGLYNGLIAARVVKYLEESNL